MKRSVGLIAATLLTASIYSQNYSNNNSSADPDSTPDYRSRQTESGAPPSSESSSSAGYDHAPGLSGGNSSTGQSNGANVNNSATNASNDQTLTTRDSNISGNEYRGTLQREPDSSFNSELTDEHNSNVGSPGSSVSGSASSSDETTVKGSGTADGAFHQPAAPVREGSQSEGWSGAGTFSGAGPGAVSDSNSRSAANSALIKRDHDLQNRGLKGDSDQLSQGDRPDMDDSGNNAVIIEEWQVLRPDQNVGAPGQSESGGSSSDERFLGNEERQNLSSPQNQNSKDSVGVSSSSSPSGDAYAQDLYRRTQKDWSVRLGTDVPHAPNMTDRTVEEIDHARLYNDSAETNVGAPGSSVTGSQSSDDATCHGDKGAKGSSAQFEHRYREGSEDLDGSVRSSGTAMDSDERLQSDSSGAPGAAVTGSSSSVEGYPLRSSGSAVDSDERLQREQDRYHLNRGSDGKYHINREAGPNRAEKSAPGEYGDRPTKENYDDGHLNGNNAAGNSESYESSSSGAEISQPGKDKTDPGRAQGGDENSATTPE